MSQADSYAQAVHDHPYGPVELIAGPVSLWLHGPRFVLEITGSVGDTLSIAAAANASTVSSDLVALITASTAGQDAVLEDPWRLVTQQTRSGADTTVRQLHLVSGGDGAVLHLDAATGGCRIKLTSSEIALLAEALRAWVEATMTASPQPARG